MKNFLFLFIFLFLTSCVKNNPPVNIPTPPQSRESARLDIEKAQSNLDKGLRNNIAIMGKVEKQKDIATDLKNNNDYTETYTQIKNLGQLLPNHQTV
jgi:hypothetical protein